MRIGSFEITRILGEGSFGRTYLAKHAILGFDVCAKQEKTRQQPFMDMFRNEASLVARLRHPSLPTLMDYIEHSDPDVGQMMILSFIRGQGLDKDIEQNGFVDDEHLCWILDRIFGCLSYLHGMHSMVHCDIKPANCILDVPDHNVTLVDLGMACLEPGARTRALGGTPDFIPPEFSQGLPPIPASDFYSVGKLAIAITGGNLVQGSFPTDMHPELSRYLSQLIRRDPTERPQDAEGVRAEIAALRRRIWGRTTCREVMKRRAR